MLSFFKAEIDKDIFSNLTYFIPKENKREMFM